ncbi:hypothetical protein ElyMa_006898100 [Elysia marginata]|uniref:Uncharacterized protein n=1 Tax=Elysia marginata TaxID=1093978 RepID=A0AAV4JC34_9GAST|nr:hypothetical protein ElyMa_006898100 [Elysia marginata]
MVFSSWKKGVGQLNSTLHDVWSRQEDREAVKRKKNDQGNHECEILGHGPILAESAYAWDTCSKNPGHVHFIPVPQFCVGHLPEKCASPALVECVKTMAALTVRLRVSYTSWGRPDGYSFSNHRGSNFLHTGSGWVRNVNAGSGPCQCLECRQSSAPSPTWYEVHLETACHVVYNTEEAQATMVDFFYDDARALAEGWTDTINAAKPIDQDEKGDTCSVLCVTHNQRLFEMLQVYLTKVRNIKYYGPHTVRFPSGWRYLCVIISHPHGQPKQVTLARATPCPRVEGSRRYFTYPTATCPGSSGAPMLIAELAKRGLVNHCNSFISLLAPHSQWVPVEGLNMSAASSTHFSPL